MCGVMAQAASLGALRLLVWSIRSIFGYLVSLVCGLFVPQWRSWVCALSVMCGVVQAASLGALCPLVWSTLHPRALFVGCAGSVDVSLVTVRVLCPSTGGYACSEQYLEA